MKHFALFVFTIEWKFDTFSENKNYVLLATLLINNFHSICHDIRVLYFDNVYAHIYLGIVIFSVFILLLCLEMFG